MPAPLFFVGLPLLFAPVVYAWRRPAPRMGWWRRAETLLAAGLALFLALLALILPFDQPLLFFGGPIIKSAMTVMGRVFEIEAVDRLALAFLFGQAAALFLGSGLVPSSRFYLPAGLAALAWLAAALFVRPFLFAALFLELAAALAVFMLGDESNPSPVARGALRFLVFMSLAMPFILLSGWLIEGTAASPEDATFVTRATLLLSAGFVVLLGVVPFHSWMPEVAEHAPPLAAAFVFTVMQFIAVFVLLTFLSAYPWLGQNPVVYRALTVAGGGMILVGAVLVFGQRNFGRSMGYALMIDVGAVLLAIGLGTPAGVEAALATLALRGGALALWGVGLAQLRHSAGSDDFDALRGLARTRPFASAAVVLSMLSLVGFPLTAGFPARWSLLFLLAHIHPTGAILLLVGMVSIGLTVARGLNALLAPLAADDEEEGAPPGKWSEQPLAVAVYAFGIIAILALGVFPQWLLPAVTQTANIFTGIGP